MKVLVCSLGFISVHQSAMLSFIHCSILIKSLFLEIWVEEKPANMV